MASWLGLEAYQEHQRSKKHKLWFEYSVGDVAEFVSFLKSDTKKWNVKYPAVVFGNSIDGRCLNRCSNQDLVRFGFERSDARDVLRAFDSLAGSYYSQKKRKRSKKNRKKTKQKGKARAKTKLSRRNKPPKYNKRSSAIKYAESFESIHTCTQE